MLYKVSFHTYPSILLNRMSNGKNTLRMKSTTDHTDVLTTLNSGEATVPALHLHFLPCIFLEWEIKPFLKSIAHMYLKEILAFPKKSWFY